MTVLLPYCKAFAVGGLLCLIGQLLIDYTKLTPGRILTIYVVSGVALGALGLYGPFAEWAGAGATVPLTGFGNLIAKGVREAVRTKEGRSRADRKALLSPPVRWPPRGRSRGWSSPADSSAGS